MAEYIDRDTLRERMSDFFPPCIDESNQAYVNGLIDAYTLIRQAPAADVVERKTGKNVAIEYDDCDQFVCSGCGIELQDWRRVEHDEDGLEVYHEYRLRFCPNCGAKMIGGDEDEAV